LISHLLDEGFSLFLDLTRFLAAIAFVAVRATIPQLGGGWFKIGAIGVDAVTVFFVLSGLVIAYVSATKRNGF